MPFGIKNLMGRLILLFSVSAGLLVLLLPGPREPIDYMIVGTFATALSLALLLALWAMSRD